MNDEANIVLSMELEEKVRLQVMQIVQNNIGMLVNYIAPILVNDPSFVTSMTRQIGSKMNTIY